MSVAVPCAVATLGSSARAGGTLEERKLPMKLVSVEYMLDGRKAVFYFTAENRIDFRDLVRDHALAPVAPVPVQRDDVAFVNLRVEIDVEFRDRSGNLRANLHGDHRIDRASRLHHVVDLALLDLDGKMLHGTAAVQAKRREEANRSRQPSKNQPFGLCFHSTFIRAESGPANIYSYRKASIGSSRDALRAG